ncbi:molybdopterin molybdotransferase MoeA [Anaplasmataceae bacterium AB001_6]|nr:molybdopterin molybdotransferase MoeA [Anaplasmataceae bacterium AB001_6]
MILYEEALKFLLKTEKKPSIILSINNACGYVAAEDVCSKVLIPAFANSAMDGFAIRSQDVAKSSKDNPTTLTITGSTLAGDKPSKGNTEGAWEITTGAPVPEEYDAVVKIEDTQIDNTDNNIKKIILSQSVPLKNNIREAGEDFMPGDTVITKGTIITPNHIMALTSIGQKNILVSDKPSVSILSTGRELINDTDHPLSPGQIYNSNSPYLLSALNKIGIKSQYIGNIPDDPEIFEKTIEQILGKNEIIISTGAVSMGKYDFIPDSLRKLGADIIFHKVAIRPGKPILYARFKDKTHYFGIPGNPVSSAVGLRFFVIPLIHHLQDIKTECPLKIPLVEPFPIDSPLRFFRKAYISVSNEGKLGIKILEGQESFKINSLVKANCWASFAPRQMNIKKGDTMNIYPLMPNKWHLENVK